MAGVLGTFEQAVLLAVLRLGSGAYGRAVLNEVQARLGRDVAAGAVHSTLVRLEEKGLLSSDLGSGSEVRAGRPRRYYRLDPSGVPGPERGSGRCGSVVARLQVAAERTLMNPAMPPDGPSSSFACIWRRGIVRPCRAISSRNTANVSIRREDSAAQICVHRSGRRIHLA